LENLEVNNSQVEVDEQSTDSGTQPEFALDENGNLVFLDGTESSDEDSTDKVEQPTDEEEDEDSDEPSDDDSEDADEEDTHEEDSGTDEEDELPKYKVKVNGEEMEVPLDELLKGYMRQADYTNKTKELAEQRKTLTNPRTPEQHVPTVDEPNLNEVAKQIAAKQLGLDSPDDLSELNFDHITAVVEAKQALLNQRSSIANRQNAILAMEEDLRAQEPAYDDIIATMKDKVDEMPHKEFIKLQQAYENGDTQTLRDMFKVLQKEYYAAKVKSSTKPKVVPKVESANQVPKPKQPKQLDLRKFGSMSSEDKAQALIDLGLV
jgi:hypothetical protein